MAATPTPSRARTKDACAWKSIWFSSCVLVGVMRFFPVTLVTMVMVVREHGRK